MSEHVIEAMLNSKSLKDEEAFLASEQRRERAPVQGNLRVRVTLGPRIEPQAHEVMPDKEPQSSLPPGEYEIDE